MGHQSDALSKPGTAWPFLLSLAVIASMAFYAWYSCHGPEVTGPYDSSGSPKFSAKTALLIVQDLTGDAIPHPAGTAQNDIVRERIEQRLTDLGIEFELHHTSHHPRRDAKEPKVALENVLFRIDADDPADDRMLVMVVSHYDSTTYGPGASDAASGVSVVLEIARMVKMTNGRKHDVLFLITDGEESGLLGADRFLAENPLVREKEIDLCINLEARGTSGPSLMFQTGPKNLELVCLMSQVVQRPFTGSLFDTVYRTLPNGTDFTLFMNAGIPGFNFAYIKNANNYHTPDDNAENLDLRSLQHHGDNAWQLIQALIRLPKRVVDEPDGTMAGESAVWFDLLGRRVLWWPARWSIWICVIAWLVWMAGICIHSGRNRETTRLLSGLTLSLVFSVALVLFSLTLGSAIEWALRLDDDLRVTWPNGLVAPALLTAYACSALAILTGWYSWRNRNADRVPKNGWIATGVFGLWLMAATGSAISLPGAVYLFLVPGALAAIANCLPQSTLFRAGAVSVVPVVAVSVIWLWLGPSLYDALGFRTPFVWPSVVAWLVTCLVPSASLLGGRQAQWFCFGSIAMTVAALIVTVAGKS